MPMCCFAHHMHKHTQVCTRCSKAVVTVKDHGCSGKQGEGKRSMSGNRAGLKGLVLTGVCCVLVSVCFCVCVCE